MQIDEPGCQVKVLRIDPFGRGNSIITSDFRDGARLETDPAATQYLVLKNYAGVMNASHGFH
jgi:hypothetical protein